MPEIQGYFPVQSHRSSPRPFLLPHRHAQEELNIALAGPRCFQLEKDGIGFWLKSRATERSSTTRAASRRSCSPRGVRLVLRRPRLRRRRGGLRPDDPPGRAERTPRHPRSAEERSGPGGLGHRQVLLRGVSLRGHVQGRLLRGRHRHRHRARRWCRGPSSPRAAASSSSTPSSSIARGRALGRAACPRPIPRTSASRRTTWPDWRARGFSDAVVKLVAGERVPDRLSRGTRQARPGGERSRRSTRVERGLHGAGGGNAPQRPGLLREGGARRCPMLGSTRLSTVLALTASEADRGSGRAPCSSLTEWRDDPALRGGLGLGRPGPQRSGSGHWTWLATHAARCRPRCDPNDGRDWNARDRSGMARSRSARGTPRDRAVLLRSPLEGRLRRRPRLRACAWPSALRPRPAVPPGRGSVRAADASLLPPRSCAEARELYTGGAS